MGRQVFLIRLPRVCTNAMARISTFASLLFVCCALTGMRSLALASKILLSTPLLVNSASHHIFISSITEPLVERGHEVVLLAPRNKLTNGLSAGATTRKIFFKNPRSTEELEEINEEMSGVLIGFSQDSLFDIYKKVKWSASLMMEGCIRLFEDEETLQLLKEEKFELLITMPILGCDALLAEYLGLPFIVITPVKRTPVFSEDTFGIPVPSSYVPFSVIPPFTDQMTFLQRTANLLFRHIAAPLLRLISSRPLRKIQLEKNIRPDLSLDQLFGKAQLWLCQTHLAFEFAQPTAPNYVSVGGISMQPVKDLSMELEDFVQGSGDHGVIVFTLGSIVTSLMDDRLTEILAKVFSELPQRVVWRLKGEKPRNQGNNTLISDWLPQKDLVGHPKTRLLIYHGGITGVYEAIGHGVPLLLMPLAGDQMSNAVRIESKGLGLVIDKNTLTEESFRAALLEMLGNPLYAKNMKKASEIMADQLVPTREKVVYYVEHILKFGGNHLRSRALELTFIELNSIDVMLFLLAVFLVLLYAIKWFICKCCICCKKTGKIKSD